MTETVSSREMTIDERVKAEMEKLFDREREIRQRAEGLKIKHEDVIMIHRLENIDTLTFLDLAEKSVAQRRRSSWYGKILKVSEVDSGEEVKEKKKESLKRGDIVSFNPESAYSLNVAGFEEIWILHIDNILVTDENYDYIRARKENLQKKFEIQQTMASQAMQRVQAIDAAKKIKIASSSQKG